MSDTATAPAPPKAPATPQAIPPPHAASTSGKIVTGPAMDRVRAALRSKADSPPPAKTAAPTPAPPAKPAAEAPKKPAPTPEAPPPAPTPPEAEKPSSEAPASETPPPAAPIDKPAEVPATPPAAGEKPAEKPPGPWQLKDKFEKRAKAAEAEVADLRAKLSKIGDAKVLQERLERIESRNKELEEVVRYHDYTKSEEYRSKYEQPMLDAWSQAVSDFRELPVVDAEGNTRVATDGDLQALVSLSLGDARRRAVELFGDNAEEAMAHYRKLRGLAAEQRRAIESVKKEGATRDQENSARRQQIAEEVGNRWSEFVKSDESDSEFLHTKEGDDEWNGALQESKAFVDSAFKAVIDDPKLTSEQRVKLVRDAATVYTRAAAYPTIELENTRLRSQVSDLEKALAEYKNAEPGRGVPQAPADETPGTIASPWDRVRAEIKKRSAKR